MHHKVNVSLALLGAPRAATAKGPRPERAPRDGQGPKGAAELRLDRKGQSQSTLQGSGLELQLLKR